MKKISAIAVAVLLFAGVSVFAATVTNQMGQVITTTITPAGLTTTILDPFSPMSVTNRTVGPVGCWLDLKADTTETLYTPRNYGDMLIGQEGSTGKVWVATGLTTNDWKAVYNP
jgi:hypothetical protein